MNIHSFIKRQKKIISNADLARSTRMTGNKLDTGHLEALWIFIGGWVIVGGDHIHPGIYLRPKARSADTTVRIA